MAAVPARIHRRRRLVAVTGVLAAAALAGGLLTGAGGGKPAPVRTAGEAGLPPAPPGLPRGGLTIFPRYRVVAFYGAPQSARLGALGIGTPASAIARLERQAKPYARPGRPVLPALELLASIANSSPGPDGMYRTRQPDAVIERYLQAARRAKALLLLDIQPGRSDFFTEAQWLERWLREPDVGLALDPEWRVRGDQVPGRVIGRVDAAEVNTTTAWLADLRRRDALPDKLVVVHQFTDAMVDEQALKAQDGLEIVLNADGFGSRGVKESKYHAFTRQAPGFHAGFKLFYEEDAGLMSPRDVLGLRPPPDFVVYE